MPSKSYCIFDTSLGYCGVSWNPVGKASVPTVCFIQLPEANQLETESKIALFCGGQQSSLPPAEIRHAINKIAKHLAGELQDFNDIPVDFSGVSEFSQAVYYAARSIPTGQTQTYGEVAKAIKRKNATRAVGQALSRNPLALIVPCHRVLAANGNSGGFTAYGGVSIKARLLAIEGVGTNW